VEYFDYLVCLVINNVRRTREIKSRIAMTKVTLNKKTSHQQFELKF
jgi:hypothetical protein